jgi:hypothetical protein
VFSSQAFLSGWLELLIKPRRAEATDFSGILQAA